MLPTLCVGTIGEDGGEVVVNEVVDTVLSDVLVEGSPGPWGPEALLPGRNNVSGMKCAVLGMTMTTTMTSGS